MYFILSKLLLFILLPLYWIIALLLLAFFTKSVKRRKRYLIASVIIFYIFTVPLFLKAFENIWDAKPNTISDTKKYSCVIVLGGFSSGNTSVDGHFNNSADRFIQGAKIMETRQASHILISGGSGQLIPGEFREAAWVRGQLLKFNIPDSLILVESRSKNTIENAAYSKVLLQKTHLPPPYLLVTSAFHMRRALLIFKKAGVPVVPYPANYFGSDINFGLDEFLPNASVLSNWEFYTKEVVGYVVTYFK
jgi:uncharacterized SAM-binding protein YcdF (DUF218 family)